MEQHNCCRCSQRKKERSPEEYKRLIHRLNRIEGQIRGIRGMVEAGAYCPDILVQAAAVNAAIALMPRVLTMACTAILPSWTVACCMALVQPYWTVLRSSELSKTSQRRPS